MKKTLPTILLIILVGFIFLLVPVVLPGMRTISKAVKLEQSKTDDKKIDKEIDKIIEHIKNSLEDHRGSLWLDDWHLKPEIENIRVFDYQRQAVNRILKDIEGKGIKLSEETKKTFKEIVNNLVEADKLLARTIIEDAKVTDVRNPRFQKIVNRLLIRAEKEYKKGLKESEKLNLEKAIKKFSKSWLFSQLAIKISTEELKLDEKDLEDFDNIEGFIEEFDDEFNWEENE